MKTLITMTILSIAFAATFVQAQPVAGAPLQEELVNGSEILANSAGLTAYVFDNDLGQTTSQCEDACAHAWPAIVVGSAAGITAPFGVNQRADGGLQLTYQNRPIYTFAHDQKVGDTNGNGLGGVWHIIVLQ